MPAHRLAIWVQFWDSLIALFETPVSEDNAVDQTVLSLVLGPSPVEFAKPIFYFKANAHLQHYRHQDVRSRTPVVSESKQKMRAALF